MPTTIRPATEADIPAISRVLIASISELCAADHGNDPTKLAAWLANKSPDGVRAMLANPAGQLFVAELDRAIAGVGGLSHDGIITLNYVAPAMGVKGVSKAMLAWLEAELKARGCVEARLEATATAQSFYESQGWLLDGPQAQGRMVNGYPMHKVL